MKTKAKDGRKNCSANFSKRAFLILTMAAGIVLSVISCKTEKEEAAPQWQQ